MRLRDNIFKRPRIVPGTCWALNTCRDSFYFVKHIFIYVQLHSEQSLGGEILKYQQ